MNAARLTWAHVALALSAALVLPLAATAAPLESSRRLATELRRAGRAEATLSWSVAGPPGRAATRSSGTLALEPPSFARLDVKSSGERVTLRADGGEWLQPSLHQLVRLTPSHTGAAMRWWRLLAGGGGARERRVAPRAYRLYISAGMSRDADSALVWLDSRGLPSRLVLDDGAGGRQEYSLVAWRFTRARGAQAFRLEAPPGVEVVELP